MSLPPALRGERIILPAAAVSQLLAMLRNVAVARLLGPEQFGIAVAFLLAQQFLDLTTDVGFNKYILRGGRATRPATQAMMQLVSVVRGGMLAVLIAGVAWPLARLFGIDPGMTPFAVLALIPLVQGFLHLDNTRQQLSGTFFNESMSGLTAEAASFVVTVALAVLTRSYIAVLAGLAVRVAVFVAISHLLAERRYRLRWSSSMAPDLARFSWPLMVNGLLLFFSQQGDRMLITAMIGARATGIYSATQLLLGAPVMLLQRVLSTRFMPRLASSIADPELHAREERGFAGFLLLAYLLTTLGFIAIAPIAVPLLYGPAYQASGVVIALIAFLQGIRFLRGWPSTVGVAVGATQNVLLSNLLRLSLAVPFGVAGAQQGYGIVGLAAGFLVGEIVALLMTQIMLNERRALRRRHGLAELALVCALALTLPVALLLAPESILLPGVLSLAALLLMLAAFAMLRPGLLPRNLKAIGW